MSHGKIVCSCGVMIAQCRCPNHGQVTTVKDGCRACSDPRAVVPAKQAQAAVLNLERAGHDLEEACALLRRAAGAITTYQCDALVLDGDVDEEDQHAGDDLLAEIGAFLARMRSVMM